MKRAAVEDDGTDGGDQCGTEGGRVNGRQRAGHCGRGSTRRWKRGKSVLDDGGDGGQEGLDGKGGGGRLEGIEAQGQERRSDGGEVIGQRQDQAEIGVIDKEAKAMGMIHLGLAEHKMPDGILEDVKARMPGPQG